MPRVYFDAEFRGEEKKVSGDREFYICRFEDNEGRPFEMFYNESIPAVKGEIVSCVADITNLHGRTSFRLVSCDLKEG